MPDDFDMTSAVDDLSESLGFGEGDDNGNDDLPDGTAGDDLAAGGGDPGAPAAGNKPTVSPEPSGVAGDPANAGKPAMAAGTPPAGGPAPAPGPTTTADAAPRSWTPAAAEKWATLDPVVKAEIAKREEDMFRGIEVYKEDATWGKGVKGILAPYLPIMQQHGIDPMAQVKNLMGAHYTLATGSPEEKGALLGKLLADYKIDPNFVPLPGGEPPHVDSEVKALRERTQALESAEQRRATEALEASKQAQTREIETFFADPANIYVKELGYDMADLLARDAKLTIADAYAQATWLNPVIRAKEIARTTAEAAAKQKAVDDAKVAEAKKAAAANVKSRPKSGSAAAPLGTIDDTMAATLAEIKGRG
jgi:hypothetical protein